MDRDRVRRTSEVCDEVTRELADGEACEAGYFYGGGVLVLAARGPAARALFPIVSTLWRLFADGRESADSAIRYPADRGVPPMIHTPVVADCSMADVAAQLDAGGAL
jgi:hypothetical protein